MKSRTRVVRRSLSTNVSTAVQTKSLFSVRLHVYFFTRDIDQLSKELLKTKESRILLHDDDDQLCS